MKNGSTPLDWAKLMKNRSLTLLFSEYKANSFFIKKYY